METAQPGQAGQIKRNFQAKCIQNQKIQMLHPALFLLFVHNSNPQNSIVKICAPNMLTSYNSTLMQNNGNCINYFLRLHCVHLYSTFLSFTGSVIPYVQPALWVIFSLLFIHLTIFCKCQLRRNHLRTTAFMAKYLFPARYCGNASAFWAYKYFHHPSFLTSNSVYFLVPSIVALNWKKGKF